MQPDRLRQYQRELAPGTPLRAGLDRILKGRTGALVVLGQNTRVKQLSSGGFQLNVEFSPQALRELAKMDGAIVLSNNLARIVAAGVHLVPSGDLPTAETGTRHRTADRTAQQTGVPVVTVSASMSTISLFLAGHRQVVETADQMLSRANQALATLASFVARLGEVLGQLNTLEIADQVTVRDLVQVAHRYEMTRRISGEVRFHIDMLGIEGRLIALQHADLIATLNDLAQLLTEDYAHNLGDGGEFTLEQLQNFSTMDLQSPSLIAEKLGFGPNTYLETHVHPRGVRLLTTVGRLPANLVAKLSDRFELQELFGSSSSDLQQIEGVGVGRARLIRDALIRITETSWSRPDSVV